MFVSFSNFFALFLFSGVVVVKDMIDSVDETSAMLDVIECKL